MPYIKKDLRPELYKIVMKFDIKNADECLEEIIRLFGTHRNYGDGCLNYFCTQLIRKYWNKTDAMIFSYMVIDKVILNPLCYDNLERAIGLVYSMRKEFKERGWGNENVIDLLIVSVENTYAGYEKQKREENGDLE